MIVDTSVIVPTLNDAATLESTLERINPVMATTNSSTEVLIVDAGSSDDTLEIAARCADKMPLLHIRVLAQNRGRAGFGSLLRLGVAYARGRYCVIVMPDARDPLELVPQMLTKLRAGADLVLCSRYEGDDDAPKVAIPWRFRLYQAVYRRAIRLLISEDIPDSTYGFRAFSRTFVQALGLNSNRLSVCPEITFKVLLAGGQVERVAGKPAGPMLQQSKFKLSRELMGYAATLARASAHRLGYRWF